MRFLSVALLSVVALASISVPVSSRHVTVSVDVDVPQHGEAPVVDAPAHLGGASAMAAIPEVPREVIREGHEGRELNREQPRREISGNRQSLNRLRETILDRHNRNAGKEILGGHPEVGPDQPHNQVEIERIRAEKVIAKEIEREYQAELQALRTAKVMAEREARYSKMNEREAKNAREVDELHDVNKVLQDSIRVETDRIAQLKHRVEANNPERITENLTPKEIVDAVHLRSIKGMFTDHELNVDPRKEQRLAKELGDYQAQMEVQRHLKEKKDRLTAMIDPIAPVTLKKVWGSQNGIDRTGVHYVFPEEAQPLADAMYRRADVSSKNIVDVPSGEKSKAMAYAAREIQKAENEIQEKRIQGIEWKVKELEKSINDNNQRISNLKNPKSEQNQVW